MVILMYSLCPHLQKKIVCFQWSGFRLLTVPNFYTVRSNFEVNNWRLEVNNNRCLVRSMHSLSSLTNNNIIKIRAIFIVIVVGFQRASFEQFVLLSVANLSLTETNNNNLLMLLVSPIGVQNRPRCRVKKTPFSTQIDFMSSVIDKLSFSADFLALCLLICSAS